MAPPRSRSGHRRNEYREEYYERIAYANEHFTGHPRLETDRGRIYITWGKADEVESHPPAAATSANP
ncbi:MAG: GWxTD domain-containing protein [Pyrinomonadaceae bacterium]